MSTIGERKSELKGSIQQERRVITGSTSKKSDMLFRTATSEYAIELFRVRTLRVDPAREI